MAQRDGLEEVAAALARLEERIGATMQEHQKVLLGAILQLPEAPAVGPSQVRDLDRGGQPNDRSPRGVAPSSRQSAKKKLSTQRTSETLNTTDTSESMSSQLAQGKAQSLSVQRNHLANVRRTILRGGGGSAQSSLQLERAGSSSRLLQKFAKRIRGRKEFEGVVAVCIAANTVSIGMNADWSIKNPGMPRPTRFAIMDYCFLCIFAVELLIRLAAEGRSFFDPKGKGFSWNVFDTLVVISTSLNEMNPLSLNLSVVRAMRPLRLVHVLRVIRLMSVFRELRLMVTGILNCGKTLLWSIILLTLVSYIFAVFCLQICSDWLAKQDPDSAHVDPKVQLTIQTIDKHFWSLPWCTYTLFKAMTSGITWGDDLSDPLYEVGVGLVVAFVLYITVTVLCVLNVITAAFVDAAQRTSQDHDANTLEHIDEREDWVKKITALFERHDSDCDGYLDWTEFKTVLKDWRTQAYFREVSLDFDYQTPRQMFNLFDWNATGLISIDDFAQGIHFLRGQARSLDMFRQFRQTNKKLDRLLLALCDDNLGSDFGKASSRLGRKFTGSLGLDSRAGLDGFIAESHEENEEAAIGCSSQATDRSLSPPAQATDRLSPVSLSPVKNAGRSPVWNPTSGSIASSAIGLGEEEAARSCTSQTANSHALSV